MWSLIIAFLTVVAVINALTTFARNRKKAASKHKKSRTRPTSPKRYAKKPNQPPQAAATSAIPSKATTINWTTDLLRSLEWKRYEEVCMEYLKTQHAHAEVTGMGADGGIDIIVRNKKGEVSAVGQCKAWSKPIGVNLIRELYGVMAAEQVKHGIFLTTSEYTPAARAFASGKNLLLIDCDGFIALINGLDKAHKQRLGKIATKGDFTTPTCVNCDVKMVKRTAQTGKNAGDEFWGCVNYPKCRNTMFVKGQTANTRLFP